MKLAVLSCSCQKRIKSIKSRENWREFGELMPYPGATLSRQQLCPVLSCLLAHRITPACRFCRTKHQPQAGWAHRQARPPEQAALHRRLLQSHRGAPAQHPLHGGQAEEPEQVQNTKEPGSFQGVQHCRYSTGGWLCVSGHV